MNYYELRDDINYPGRWYLGDIYNVDDNWQFTSGFAVDATLLPTELFIKIHQDGKPMDYTTTEGYSIPLKMSQYLT